MDKTLPLFYELVERKLEVAGHKDKIINIKVTRRTAQMMVEHEHDLIERLESAERENKRLREALGEVEMFSHVSELRHSKLESVCIFCGIAQFLDETKHSNGCPMNAVEAALNGEPK